MNLFETTCGMNCQCPSDLPDSVKDKAAVAATSMRHDLRLSLKEVSLGR